MASRTLNRRALREPNDEAEAPNDGTDRDDGDDTPAPKVKKARTRKGAVAREKKPAKARAPRKKSVKADPRTVARWAVCDNGMKRVAVFEYKDRSSADAKLIQIRESKTGTFFLVMVKDPYDLPEEPAVALA